MVTDLIVGLAVAAIAAFAVTGPGAQAGALTLLVRAPQRRGARATGGGSAQSGRPRD
jgi:hypothetical protein